MAYNKVVYDGQTLIDLTDLNVTASDVASGVTFILADGTKAVGTLISTSTPTADTIAEFDSTAHMNSTDMTSSEVSDFVDGLNVSGTSVLSVLANSLVTESHSASVSLPASDAVNVDIDMTKSGYTLLAIASVATSGTGSTLGWISSFTMSSATTARVTLRNSTSTARSYTCTVTGLYLKNA